MSPTWSIRGRVFSPAPFSGSGSAGIVPFCIWGIINVTPDSFSDGGHFFANNDAVQQAHRLRDEGATILDVGGASSRPGSADVSVAEEQGRVLPVLHALLAERNLALNASYGSESSRPFPSGPLLSVDTWRAAVANAALEMGADILNDISACLWEPELLDVVAQYKPGYVLMHCQGRPDAMQNSPVYHGVVDDVLSFWEERMAVLVKAGLPEDCIMLDPGIGFGKTLEHNLALLQGLEQLQTLGRPLLLGLSRKSMFHDLFGLPVLHRDDVTSICTALAAARGVEHHRVHNVAAACRALALVRRCSPV